MSEETIALRARKNQEFDGEAHLTNEELDALLDCVESSEALRNIAGSALPYSKIVHHLDLYDAACRRLRASQPSHGSKP